MPAEIVFVLVNKVRESRIVDRHSVGHATGPRVAEFLQRAIDQGEPMRLAWPQPHAPALNRDGYPTAELPIITSDGLTGGAR